MNVRSVAVAAVLALAVGTAFVQSEAAVRRKPVKNRTTVLYWEKWTGDEAAKMRRIVDNFNASQDEIHVKMLSISGVADKTLLSASGGNPPDVAGLWDTQMTQFKDAGALTDLGPLAREFGIRESDYIPGYWKMMTPGGTLVALPTTPASNALHINLAYLPNGMKPPATIEELDAFTEAVSKVEPGGKVKLAGFLPAEPGWWNYGWGSWFGGKLVDGDRLTINSPENIRAYTWTQSYSKRFGVRETQNFQSGFGNFSSPQNAFMSR
ncbi:MAG: extracellular solute-binding protein, partial [Armatimonadota bacterium]